MIDIPSVIKPLYHNEILTISEDHTTILTDNLFDPVNNPQSFPTNFVGRIYTNGNSVGTGFVHMKNGSIFIVSAKHVQASLFSEDTRFFICFDYDQYFQNLSQVFDYQKFGHHVCRENLYEIVPFNLNFNIQTDQKDPVTGELYSIDNDICVFSFLNQCICGNSYTNPPPYFNFLDISFPSDKNTDVVLFGFPGSNLTQERVLPQAPELSDQLEAKQNTIPPNKLTYTTGKIIGGTDLIAISNPSIGGMSGGPLIYCEEGAWKICGLLIGGPAVKGHRELVDIYQLKKAGEASECLKRLQKIEGLLSFLFYKPMFDTLLLDFEYDFESFKENLINCYYKLLKKTYWCEVKLNPDVKNILNHNLAVNVSVYL